MDVVGSYKLHISIFTDSERIFKRYVESQNKYWETTDDRCKIDARGFRKKGNH